MSLNARNIPLKSVFKILGDFAGLKMETADSVAANVDVTFSNAPWDYIFSYLIAEHNLLWR